MKNRPKSKYLKHSPFAGVKTLVTSGFGLIGIGSLLLFTFFVSSNSLQQEQDIQSDASVKESDVHFIQSVSGTTTAGSNQENTIEIDLNTGTYKLKEVTAIFDVVTEVTSDIIVEGASSNLTYTIEKENADHGFKVSVVAVPKQAAAGIATNRQSMDLIDIKLTPAKAGPVALVYDRDRSHAYEFGMEPNNDLLQHPKVFLYQVSGDTPSSTIYPEDLFSLNDNLNNYFKFYETSGSQNEIDPRNLIKTRTYRVRHTARVQNVNDESTFDEDPIIVSQLRVNNSENVTRTFNRSNLTRQSTPLEIQFDTTFQAQDVNTFALTVDSTNVFPELNEKNNTVSVSYSTSPTGKACNEVCSSNADCGDNHSCYDTGSEKRCRLSTNLTSTSCTSDSTKRNLSCNQECSDNNQCGNGLTCWENRCRNPYNTGSTSCVNLDARTQQLIAESCNDSCSANRDCANNMRCFNGSCRLATNPSSTSCSAATQSTVSKGGVATSPTATATPRPTATPVATTSATVTPTPTPTPTATPTPAPVSTPEPTPEPDLNATVLDSFFDSVKAFFNSQNLFGGSLLTNALLPLIVIGAGILLLILALVIALKPKKSPISSMPPKEEATPATPKTELHAKPNPPPPPIPSHGTIMPKQTSVNEQTDRVESGSIKDPSTIEMPEPETKPLPTPTAGPAQSTPAPSDSSISPAGERPNQSMLQRLREKGIKVPEKSETSPSQQPSSSSDATEPAGEDASPPTSAWPNEEQK